MTILSDFVNEINSQKGRFDICERIETFDREMLCGKRDEVKRRNDFAKFVA